MSTDLNNTEQLAPIVAAPSVVVVDAEARAIPSTEQAAIPAQAGEHAESAMTEEEERAERLYPADGSPPLDGNYSPAIREVFASMFDQARETGDETNVKAVQEGKAQVLSAMTELGVGNVGAREMAHVFSRYQADPLDDDAIANANTRAVSQLREKWGNRFDSNLRHARTAFEAACQRIPWLLSESQNGAGSDPAVIQHFAAIGRRMARKSNKS